MGGGFLINLSALVSASVCCTQQPPTHSTHTETQTHTHVAHIYTVLVTHFHPDLLLPYQAQGLSDGFTTLLAQLKTILVLLFLAAFKTLRTEQNDACRVVIQ